MSPAATGDPVAGGDAVVHRGEVLRTQDLSKRFDETVALDAVSLSVQAGEVLGLCGHNGSGKSTLIKILSGYHRPESGGHVWLGGVEIDLPIQPSALRELGMAFVHQDLGIVDELSIVDNLRISRWSSGFSRVRWRDERRRCVEALRRYGIEASPDDPASTLSAAEKTILAIVRGLQSLEREHGGLFVLDEPTTHLPLDETEQLFRAVTTLQASGHGVIFVSHRLDEVLRVCDRVAVLRSGRLVETAAADDLSEERLAELIVGRELQAHERVDRSHAGTLALECSAASGGRVEALDLRLHAGEIVGVTGLAGSGFEQIPYLLYGALPRRSGAISVAGRPVSFSHPSDSIAAGLALVPDERLRFAAAAEATVMENVTLSLLDRYATGPLIRAREERAAAQEMLLRHNVLPPNPDALLGSLSGGNQQKVVIARALAAEPEVLLLHEPAQGVDIEARNQIFAAVDAAAQAGTAVLLATTEYEDLARFANRILVFAHGRIKAELVGDELSAHAIEHACLVS